VDKSSGLKACDSRLVDLRPEFRLSRDILEQPSPTPARYAASQRFDSVGQPASAVLAIAYSFHDRMDGRESLRILAGCGLRDRIDVCWCRLFHSDKGPHQPSWPRVNVATSMGHDSKGKISVAVYAIAIPLAFAKPRIAGLCYVVVAVIWLSPDPRIEKNVAQPREQ